MARWKITASHYLRVKGTKWEYSEISRVTNKPVRKTYDVPTLLDPNDPGDWNYVTARTPQGQAAEGDVIVAWENGKQEARDILFEGPPTPDMTPMDAEAEAESAKYAKTWKHPINDIDSTFSNKLLNEFQAQVAMVQSQNAAQGAGTVKVEGMEELLAAITTLIKQQVQPSAAAAGIRKV